MTILCMLLSMLLPGEAGEAPSCTAEYGEAFEFSGCEAIELPDFEIEFTGAGRPDPDVPMFCKNYEARDGQEAVSFSFCTTGIRGGPGEFTLAGRKYAVDRDAFVRCADERPVRGLRIWRDSEDLLPYSQRAWGDRGSRQCKR